MTANPLPDTETDAPVLPSSRQRRGASRHIPSGVAALVLLGVGYGVGRYAERTTQERAACVVVNNIPITDQAFQHRLEVASGSNALRQMIEEELRLQFARSQGVYPTDADVEAKLEEARQLPDFAAKLSASHQTEADLRQSLRVAAAQQNVLTRGVSVSDSDVKAFYDANVNHNNPQARYYHPETVQIAAIVAPSETAGRKSLAMLASGQSFADVARVMSNDRSAVNGGVMPPFQRGRMNPAQFPDLQKLVFSLQAGQQTDVIKIGASRWVIRCLSHAPETQVAFDKVRAECRTGAMLVKGLPLNGQRVNTEFASFRKSADIKAIRSEFKDAAVVK